MGDLNHADLALTGWTIIVGVIGNVACALLGCYLVLRRLSLMGDAISHAVLPGIVLAFMLSGQLGGWPTVVGAMAVGMLTAFLTQGVHELGDVPEDASMGVVFTSLFALGVVLLHTIPHVDLDPGCVLYGLIETVALDLTPVFGVLVPRALLTLVPVLLLTLGFIGLLWKELKLMAFDPALATAMGLNATVLFYLLMGMTAAVTVASFEAVGSVLVVAMLIVPAATAHLLTDRFGWMMVWSAVIAAFAAVFGAIAGRLFSTSVAGMMAVGVGLVFGLAVVFAPRYGIVSKLLRNARLSLRIVSEDVIGLLYRAEEAGAAPVALRGLLPALARFRLLRRGLLQYTPDGVALTAAGRRSAESVVRAHRLWETYLEKDFALPLDHIHDPAERIEHYLGPGLQSELARDLGEPKTDPQGKAIPPG